MSDVVEKTPTRRRSRIPCVAVEKITTRRREGRRRIKKKVDELSTKIGVITYSNNAHKTTIQNK